VTEVRLIGGKNKGQKSLETVSLNKEIVGKR
jgi:hypothetical protein